MQFRFETGPGGQRRAVTQGMAGMGQYEFALDITDHVTDDTATQVLRYVTDYVATSGQKILPGETMRYGWSTLRFTQDGEWLVVEELANPFATSADAYIRGAARSIAILTEQDAAVQRNAIPAAGHHPHRSELAVVCRRLAPDQPRTVMVFDRLKSQRTDDSGWFIGCGNQAHNHNDVNELARIHLVYVAELDPRVVYYLAMPEDTRVVFERTKVIVFAPGQQDGRVDA